MEGCKGLENKRIEAETGGKTEVETGDSPLRMRTMRAGMLRAVKGLSKLQTSYSTQPKAQTSLGLPYGSSCSHNIAQSRHGGRRAKVGIRTHIIALY
jgi:hypothetical protein